MAKSTTDLSVHCSSIECQKTDGNYYISINKCSSRYVQPLLSEAISKAVQIMIRSDMNTGKTHALAHVLSERLNLGYVSIIIVSLASLTKATTESLQRKMPKATVINYADLMAENAHDVDVIVTTENSFPRILEQAEQAKRKLDCLVFDESESDAQFLASGTINNKYEVAGAFKKAASEAHKVIFMDAHLGEKTKLFAETFGANKSTMLINNQYQVWKNHTFSKYKSVDDGIALVATKLQKGERVFIPCTSAQQAERLYEVLGSSSFLDGLKVLKAFKTSDGAPDSDELQAAKSNPKLFLNYDLVIASPTCGTGISIEEDAVNIANNSEHFDSVIAFLTRDKRAPDAYSALQMLFRVRHMRQKHIDIVEIDNATNDNVDSAYQLKQESKDYKALLDAAINNCASDEQRQKIAKATLGTLLNYQTELDIQNAENFKNYFDIIDNELNSKGLVEVPPINLPKITDLKEIKKEAKASIEARNKSKIINALVIDRETAKNIKWRKDDYRQHVTANEIYSLKKYNLIRSYHFNDDLPTRTDIENYLKMDEAGIAQGRNAVGLSLILLKDINAIQRAFVNGVGENEAFKKDIAGDEIVTIKVRWQLFRILADIIGLTLENNTYSIGLAGKLIDGKALKTINKKRESHLQLLMQIANDWNSTKPKSRISKPQLKKEPAKTVRKLVETHFKLKTTKPRGVDGFCIKEDQPVIDNANQHAKKYGSFGYGKLLNSIKAHQALDENKQFTEEVASKIGLTEMCKQHIKECLEMIPHTQHFDVLCEYLRIASSERLDGERFTPIANANSYILKAAGLKNSGVMGGKKH